MLACAASASTLRERRPRPRSVVTLAAPSAALKELFGLQHDCERGKRLRLLHGVRGQRPTMGMWSSARRRKMKSLIDGAIRTSGSSVGPAASNRRSVNFET
jgi:hypothetical protein